MDVAVLLLGIYLGITQEKCPHKDLDSDIHSSFIHSSPKLERTQMPINWWLNKQIVVNSYIGILLSNDKDEFQEQYANWKTPDTGRSLYFWFHLYETLELKAKW